MANMSSRVAAVQYQTSACGLKKRKKTPSTKTSRSKQQIAQTDDKETLTPSRLLKADKETRTHLASAHATVDIFGDSGGIPMGGDLMMT